jgi:predicted nucleic acid-binding protein
LRSAYVDSSVLVAIAFDEPGAAALERRLARCDALYSSLLTEAEILAALRREDVEVADREELFAPLAWVLPDRRLTEEMTRTLAAGYLRGADLWHVASALFLEPEPRELVFLTLDAEQRRVASRLGFPT